MLDNETGYIKLNKFAATTEKEFSDAVTKLKKSNMKNLVLDLRGNGGGYMLAATELAKNSLPIRNCLFIYLEEKHPDRTLNHPETEALHPRD